MVSARAVGAVRALAAPARPCRRTTSAAQTNPARLLPERGGSRHDDTAEDKETGEWVVTVGGLSPRTVVHLRQVLKAATGLMDNPCDGLTLPKISSSGMLFLDADQASTLLDAVEPLGLGSIVVVALERGACEGELSALPWSRVRHLDTAHATIEILESVVRGGRSGSPRPDAQGAWSICPLAPPWHCTGVGSC